MKHIDHIVKWLCSYLADSTIYLFFNQLILIRRLNAALSFPGISSPKPTLSSKVYLFSRDTRPGSHPKLAKNKLAGSPVLQELSIRVEASFAIEDGFSVCCSWYAR